MTRKYAALKPLSCAVFDIVLMAPRRAPNAAKIAERLSTPAVKLDSHFLTSGMKPIRNLSGQYTRENIDLKSYEEFAALLTAETSSVLSRPAIGMSYHMATLSRAAEELLPYVDARILGSGVSNLVTQLQKLDPEYACLNSFADGADRRTEQEHQSAIERTARQFQKMHASHGFQQLTLSMRQAGVRLLHYSQALAELMAFWGEDALKTARAIPATQPMAEHLSAAAKSSSGHTAGPRLQLWLTRAYQDKIRSHGRRPSSAAAHTTNFADITLSDEEGADTGDRPRGARVGHESPVLSPAVASPRQRSVSLSIPRAVSSPTPVARRPRGRPASPPPAVRSSRSAPVLDAPASASADSNNAVLAMLQSMQSKMEEMDRRITTSRLEMKKESITDDAIQEVPDDAVLPEPQRRNTKSQEESAPAPKRSRRIPREETHEEAVLDVQDETFGEEVQPKRTKKNKEDSAPAHKKSRRVPREEI